MTDEVEADSEVTTDIPSEDEEVTDPDRHLEEQVPDLDQVSADKLEVHYNGAKRTVTSVVRIMRQEGSVESAEYLENLAKLGKGVQKLVEVVQHKRATGTYGKPILRKKDPAKT